MAVLNHHIVYARDNQATALWFSEMLGLPRPTVLGEFAVLEVSRDTSLDFHNADDHAKLHYAFLVSEAEFDQIFARIKDRGLLYWSDPFKGDPGRINYWDDGRGVYFEDPNGHLLEILTRPYGSGGTRAQHPHPLVARPIDTAAGGDDDAAPA